MNGSRASLAHLYRRGGFGGRPEEIDPDTRAVSRGRCQHLELTGAELAPAGAAPYAPRSADEPGLETSLGETAEPTPRRGGRPGRSR